MGLKALFRRSVARAVASLPPGILMGREHFEIFERAGIHVTPAHFYGPIPRITELDPALWSARSAMLGIDQNVPAQLDLLRTVAGKGYLNEYGQLPVTAPSPGEYGRSSGFGGSDGAILYAIVRHIRPCTIIEIGSGFSTLLSVEATRKNGGVARVVAIEPYPRDFLRTHPNIELVEQRVETLDPKFFDCLAENDVLFIDSSHTVRIGGDVLYEILEILPRLKSGVWIHIHDIFLPRHYPKEWVLDRLAFWTEQYIVQAFLCFNREFEIAWSAGIMEAEFAGELEALIPDYVANAGSLWIRRC